MNLDKFNLLAESVIKSQLSLAKCTALYIGTDPTDIAVIRATESSTRRTVWNKTHNKMKNPTYDIAEIIMHVFT